MKFCNKKLVYLKLSTETISTQSTTEINIDYKTSKIDVPEKILEYNSKHYDNKIYFGSYPQKKVNDESLINALNTKAGSLPTSLNTNGWTDYNYYSNNKVESYMFYKDIDFDGNGTNDYRGVYFFKYRPETLRGSYNNPQNYQENKYFREGYPTNTVYWFSFDPIKWDVLTTSGNKKFIVSHFALDGQEYCDYVLEEKFSHNGGVGYSSNYELSNIRKFLNETFYKTAFNESERNKIVESRVNNGLSSSPESMETYLCNDTTDRLFLMSYNEVQEYCESESLRKFSISDYAIVQGVGFSWLLRSPYGSIMVYSCSKTDGRIYGSDSDAIDCIRPACWISL